MYPPPPTSTFIFSGPRGNARLCERPIPRLEMSRLRTNRRSPLSRMTIAGREKRERRVERLFFFRVSCVDPFKLATRLRSRLKARSLSDIIASLEYTWRAVQSSFKELRQDSILRLNIGARYCYYKRRSDSSPIKSRSKKRWNWAQKASRRVGLEPRRLRTATLLAACHRSQVDCIGPSPSSILATHDEHESHGRRMKKAAREEVRVPGGSWLTGASCQPRKCRS
jgi:hypothetical protein